MKNIYDLFLKDMLYKFHYLSHLALLGILTFYMTLTSLHVEMPVKLNPEKTIILVDASSYLYRAYYSMRPLHTLEGQAVQAVYGFCRMVKKLIDKFDPQYCALVWDSKGKTTRHDMYPAYKATREAPPSDLFTQKEYIIKFADLIGCLQVAQPGIEADDLIYSIAQEQVKNGYTVIMVTSDKDMGQALNDQVLIYDAAKDFLYNVTNYEQKTGIPVAKLPFYFALLGDASDNIPGVRGIGKKGAEELVHQFDSLQDMYDRMQLIQKPRTRAALEAHKSDAFISYDLFLLQYYPSGITVQNLAFDKKNWRHAIPFFQELQFKSLLPKEETEHVSITEKRAYWENTYTFKLVTTQEQLDALCADLETYKAFGLDTETNGIRPLQSTFVGMSFCVKEGEAYYVPINHKTFEQQLPKKEIFDALKPFLESEQYAKYLHNTKFDQKVFHAQGIELKGIAHDTIIAASLVAKDGRRVGLKHLSLKYFGENMLSYDEAVQHGVYQNFSYVPLHEALYYAAADAHQTYKLVDVMEKELAQENMEHLYYTLELPITQILYDMECKGIICDPEVLAALNERVTKEITYIEGEIQKHADLDAPINLNSPKQVQHLLFTILKLPPQKKSDKGVYSTDQSVLVELARIHPVPELMMRHRELSKLKNTYIDALPEYINPKTGRIHTSYNQVSVATGRLASVEPNLQNIPLDSVVSIRSAFKPQEGHIFISADYSQIELRVLAYLSRDETLMRAFKENKDIHSQTAAGLFQLPIDQIANEQRQVGKRINFSVLYGMTPYGLSKDMDISFADAKLYIDRYFKQYPGVLAWMDDVIAFAKKHGYVETLWGRRRYIPAIYEKNRMLYQEAQRVAINTVAQGTAAELMKIGMIRLFDILASRGHGEHMLLQIHDELLISVPESTAQEVDTLIRSALEGVVSWEVPLVVTTRHGKDWQAVSK